MSSPSILTPSARDASIPAIGLGTGGLGACGEIVAHALKLGYRHIDTAWKYGSEKGVGQGIRASRIPRYRHRRITRRSHTRATHRRITPNQLTTIAKAAIS